ncbi:Epsin-1 [Yarrowia sp. C11]|nr:Epsin-1 [Yarrowia sp. C11]KAG5359418.1 Epsin-1 [Yarrowia sp. E02]
MSKSIVRSIKNVTNGYTSAQVKVRNATSNDAWGPSTFDLEEIARLTHSNQELFEVMDMIDRRLNDKGKNWRHVIKALNLLDYCIHCGSENVVLWCKDNLYVVKTLREFHYIDENGRDQGASIRSRAKEITSLLLDDERLRSERANRSSWKKGRRAQGDDYGSDEDGGIISSRTRTAEDRRGDRRGSERGDSRREARRPSRRGSTPDDDLARALAESQRTAEEEARLRQNGGAEDEALRKAIALSEEEQKNRDLGGGSASGAAQPINLIDTDSFPNQFQPQQQMQPTGYDLFGNAIYGQQQPTMNTGVLQNAYATGGMFDQQPNQFQQQQQFQPQQQQYTGFQAQQPQQQQYTGYQQQNDFSQSFQQQQPAEPLQPLKTGSNNPFAKQDSTNGSSSTGPSLDFMASNNMTTQSHPNQQQQQQQQQHQQQQQSAPKQRAQVTGGAHPELNNLLMSGDGLDTYGNTGETRIPAQHTRDTFMNTRLQPQATANNNPFVGQQYTGIPSTQIQPAVTGYGFGNAPQQTGMQQNNGQQQYGQQQNQQQYGQQQYGQYGQQQNQQQQYGGGAPQQSLIDL